MDNFIFQKKLVDLCYSLYFGKNQFYITFIRIYRDLHIISKSKLVKKIPASCFCFETIATADAENIFYFFAPNQGMYKCC